MEQNEKSLGVAASQPLAHTPLPYLLDGRTVCSLNVCGVNRMSFHVQQGWADKHDTRTPIPELEATAEFIVRACNSHYELLNCLKAAAADFAIMRMERMKEWDAAIAKAEGKTL